MGAAIRLRGDFDAAGLRRLAKRSRDGAQSRRLLALAMICDGHRRSDAARFAGVGLQIVRDWVLRFNAEGPEGLMNRKAPGPPYKLGEEQRAALGRRSWRAARIRRSTAWFGGGAAIWRHGFEDRFGMSRWG